MHPDWLETLQVGKFEARMPSALLRIGDLTLRGNCRVNWSAGEGVRVQAETDGSAEMQKRFDTGVVDVPGTLFPRDRFVHAEGYTQEGWHIEVEPAFGGDHDIHTDSPYVLWDYRARSLKVTRLDWGADRRSIRILLGPPPKFWTRRTTTESRNEFFIDDVTDMDWMLISTTYGDAAARRRTDELFEFSIRLFDKWNDISTERVVNAATRCFSMLTGKALKIRGYVDLTLSESKSFLWTPDRMPTKRRFPPPIDEFMAHIQGAEQLVGNAFDYFMLPESEPVARLLSLCWDTADNDIPTKHAAVGIAAEGLLREASRKRTDTDGSFTDLDVEYLKTWLNSNPGALSPRLVKRLRGYVGTLGHRRPKDILEDWRTRGILGVCREDITAWSEIRNSAAHAESSETGEDRAKLQAQITQYHRVANLINRVVLQLVGYRGAYIDYANLWQLVDFPATDAEL